MVWARYWVELTAGSIPGSKQSRFFKWILHYLKQTKISFFFFYKSKNRRVEEVPVRGREGGERAWESEYSANNVYTCM
jgi:hypothetical protein